MKLLPSEWDLIIRALNVLSAKIDADANTTGFYDSKRFEKRAEITRLIERIELNK